MMLVVRRGQGASISHPTVLFGLETVKDKGDFMLQDFPFRAWLVLVLKARVKEIFLPQYLCQEKKLNK